MTKSLVTYILGAAHAVLDDYMCLSPAPAQGVDRDKSRLTSLAHDRGLPVFTLDLPALGKHFDKCLADGCYIKPELPLTRVIRGSSSIPRLFSGLMLAIFEPCGMLRSDACVHAISALRQIYNLARKLEIPCDEARTYETVRDFYTIEEGLPPPTLRWGEDDLNTEILADMDFVSYQPDLDIGLFAAQEQRIVPRSHLVICQKVFDIITTTLGDFDPLRWKAKHGSGAVSDGQLGKFYKYEFPVWSSRLEPIFPYDEFAFANLSLWADSAASRAFFSKEDVPSQLLCVPKTQKGPRLIAKEPTANQWVQQLLLDYFATRISKSWIGSSIHLDDQSYNQKLAASASRTGSHWTVDLSSASDRVTCRFVERAFRKNPFLLEALNASRTHYLSQKIDKKSPQLIKLKKFSTMGSACTFPVECLIFFGLALSSLLIARNLRAVPQSMKPIAGEILVFGDDIVIPDDGGLILEGLLKHFSFEVNPNKTFKHGKFRESCGMDCFDGVDVTPSYIPRPPKERQPESIASQVSASNNFFRRGYWRTAAYLQSQTPGKDLPVVAVGSGALGFESFCGSPIKETFFDDELHREYILAPKIRSKVDRIESESGDQLLQFFTEAPDPLDGVLWHVGYVGRPRQSLRRGRVYLEDLGKVVKVI
jgi:hypothetical protein